MVHIALVGRPNVGKSTIFNALIGKRLSITHHQSFATRDVISDFLYNTNYISILDAPGLLEKAPDEITLSAMSLAKEKLRSADLVIFVLSAPDGITAQDEALLQWCYKQAREILFVINKSDRDHSKDDFAGLENPFYVSAEHRQGVKELSRYLKNKFRKEDQIIEEKVKPKIAILGKPNVGKSSLMNLLTRMERSLVSSMEGTTRDPVKQETEQMILWDTAGIRLKGRKQELDFLSQERAKKIIQYIDVVYLMVDYEEGPTMVDAKLIELIRDLGKSLIVLCNKWDLSKKTTNEAKEFFTKFREKISFDIDFPILFVSCHENRGIDKLLETTQRLYSQSANDYKTSYLNRLIQKKEGAVKENILFISQLSKRPLKFKVRWRGSSISQTERRSVLNWIYDALPESRGLSIRLDFELREARPKVKKLDGKSRDTKRNPKKPTRSQRSV